MYQNSPVIIPLNDSNEHNRESSTKNRILPYDNSPSPKRGSDNNLSRNGSLLNTMTNSLYPSRRNFLNNSTENSRIYRFVSFLLNMHFNIFNLKKKKYFSIHILRIYYCYYF